MNAQPEAFSTQPPLATPRKVKAGPPLSWISESASLLRQNWSVLLPAYFFVMIVSMLIQFGVVQLLSGNSALLSGLAIASSLIIIMLLNAGILAVFHGAAEGRPRFADVFSGMRGHTLLHMVLMLVFMVLAIVAIGFVGYMITGSVGASASSFSTAQFGNMMNSGGGMFDFAKTMAVTLGGGFGALCLLGALFLYAVPLIVISRQGAVSAINHSFRASFKNLFVLIFFLMNAFLLGNLLFVPALIVGAASTSIYVIGLVMVLVSIAWGVVLMGAYYFSFRDALLESASE